MTLWQASTELLTATAAMQIAAQRDWQKNELATATLAGLGMGLERGLEVASEQESERGLGYAAEQLEAGLSDTSG